MCVFVLVFVFTILVLNCLVFPFRYVRECLQTVLQEPCHTFKGKEDKRDRMGEEQQDKEEIGQSSRIRENSTERDSNIQYLAMKEE